MSEIRVIVCDECQKESKDYMGDGFIEVTGFIKYKGRDKNNCAECGVYINSKLHFCSWSCFRKTKIGGLHT
jgi:hypothetical protein